MFERHRFVLFWLVYVVVILLTLTASLQFGLIGLIWVHDVTYLSSVIALAWIFTEAVGGIQLIQLYKIDVSTQKIDESALWNKHSFVNFMSEIIVAAGIFGTVIGVIVALMPFFAMTSFQLSVIQPQLLHMFAGIAVAFFPTAFSILIKIFLDFHSRLHQSAVIDLLKSVNN